MFNTKAEPVITTCKILVDEYGGGVPKDREPSEALPRVDRKTANLVLNTAFGRFSDRTKIAAGEKL